MSNKRNTKNVEIANIALKTIHDDIMRDNANATITTKKMRARLRATMRDVHVHNASWLFTQSQYDVVRSMFDNAYAQKIARAQKRATNATRKQRAQTRDDATQSNVENVE